MDTEEYCIGCGYWRPNLIDRTGVCAHCTAAQEDKVVLTCIECKREKPVKRGELRPMCSACRQRVYIAKDPAYRLYRRQIRIRQWHNRKKR